MKHQLYKLLFITAALTLVGCECPYLEETYGESNYEYYRRTGYDRLTADRLPGLWQCYYPMYVGNVEFKEVRIFSNGKADIIMEDVTKGNTTYQFQITGYLSPELYLRDSFGKYTWAYRRTEDCIK